jgi:hypothetical protein
MPDWSELVREKLATLNLPPSAKEEVISELAAHLEDGYQNEIARGLGESEASQHVLSEVQWNKLAREIRRATRKEESMNNRSRALWLPASVNLTVAAVLLIILVELGVDARMTRSSFLAIDQLSLDHPDHVRLFVLIYKLLGMIHLSWLLTLPFSAAAGCLMAKRAQASAAVRLIVGLAPSLLWLAVFVAMSLEFELDRWQFPTGFPLEFSYFALSALGWIVLPSVPLLLGTLPFLREPNLSRAETN